MMQSSCKELHDVEIVCQVRATPEAAVLKWCLMVLVGLFFGLIGTVLLWVWAKLESLESSTE